MAFNVKMISSVMIVIMIFCISTVTGAIQYSAIEMREPVGNVNSLMDAHSIVSSGYYGSTTSIANRDDSEQTILQRAILKDQLYKNIFKGFSMDPDTPYSPLDVSIPYSSTTSIANRDDSEQTILQRAILEDQLYKNMFKGFSMDPDTPYTPLDESIPVKFMLFSSTGSDVYSIKINGIYTNSFIPHMDVNQIN